MGEGVCGVEIDDLLQVVPCLWVLGEVGVGVAASEVGVGIVGVSGI